MKKTALYILVTILGGLVLYFTQSNSNTTLKNNWHDFSITDTATVDKIFLQDKDQHTILLERKNGYWQLNGSYEAHTFLVNQLLTTLCRIQVKEPVSKALHNEVIKSFDDKSTRVEIYINNTLSKVINIGGSAPKAYGTYVLLENSSSPFIVEVPGVNIDLSNAFSTHLNAWKTMRIFNFASNQLKSVSLENHEQPQSSFMLKKASSAIKLYSYPQMEEKVLADSLAANNYFAELKNKKFSKSINDIATNRLDSIIKSQAMYTLTITDINGEQKKIKAYVKPAWGKVDAFGEPFKNDPDTFIILLDNEEFVYAQYYDFDALFKALNTFTKN